MEAIADTIRVLQRLFGMIRTREPEGMRWRSLAEIEKRNIITRKL